MIRMLRKLMFVAVPAAMLAFTPLSANADHRSHGHRHGHHGHHGHYYRGGFNRGFRLWSPGYYRGYGYRPYRYSSPYYYGSPYYGYYGGYAPYQRFGFSTPGFHIWF